jgi:hypothetical protein
VAAVIAAVTLAAACAGTVTLGMPNATTASEVQKLA